MNYDVFISYSRKDSEIANQICDAFDKANITYFIDRQGIAGGFEFPAVLAEALLGCKVVLYLASRNSYESKFTNAELTFAFNEKPKNSVIPYIIDGSTMPASLRFVFSNINWLTIENNPIDTVLIEDIKRLLTLSSDEFVHITTAGDSARAAGDSAEAVEYKEEYDPEFCKVAFSIFENESPYASYIQNNFCFGFQKAGRIISKLVDLGIISPANMENGTPAKLLVSSIEEVRTKLLECGILRVFKVGDYYNANDKEGIVFEIDPTGTTGKILSLTDVQGRYEWYNNPGKIFRTKNFQRKEGDKNHEIITREKNWYKLFPAFAVCTDYGPEWYLPAEEDLLNISENLEEINASLEKNGGKPMQKGWDYWSSSKNVNDEAISVNMKTGRSYFTHEQSKVFYVRAVTKF